MWPEIHVALHASWPRLQPKCSLTKCISLLPDAALPTVSVHCQMQPYQLYQFTARCSLTKCISSLPDAALPTVSVHCQMQRYQLYQFTARCSVTNCISSLPICSPPNFTTQPHSQNIHLPCCLAQRFTSHQPYLLHFPTIHVASSQPLPEERADTAKRPEEHTFFSYAV